MSFDLLIENAHVVDGTGAPWFRGAVAVEDGSIAAVLRERDQDHDAELTVDADGSVVSPGFIDAHSHSDLRLFTDPSLAPKTRQGITTEIVGQDGFSMAPMYRTGGAAEWESYLAGLAGRFDGEWPWGSVADYLDAVDDAGVASNVATLVGHGTVRFDVLGMEDVEPTDAELDEMAALVREGLEDGAIGFSTGLVYTPQVYADTAEVARLAAELVPYGRPFVAHIRSEGRWMWEAMDEFIDIGAREGIPLHISHFKVTGREQRGKAGRALELVETARDRGVDITADQYPYTAGSSMLSSLLPPWVQSMRTERMLDALADEGTRERIGRDIEEWRIDGWENVAGKTGWERIRATNLTSDAYAEYDGSSIAEIARQEDATAVAVLCDILIAEELEANTIAHGMSADDVHEIFASERVAVGTDGLFGGRPHPRVYGSFPKVLGDYVRTRNLMTLEAAVRKMTSLPARAMGLDGKGVLRPGMDADLVVFDPQIVDSRATFDDPVRYPRGIQYVFVNGEAVVRNGASTDARPGEAIRP